MTVSLQNIQIVSSVIPFSPASPEPMNTGPGENGFMSRWSWVPGPAHGPYRNDNLTVETAALLTSVCSGGCRLQASEALGLPSVEADVLVGDPEVVDAAVGRRDPPGELAGFGHTLHQASDKAAILLARQPILLPGAPLFGGNGLALGCGMHARPGAGRSPKAQARQ